jgi:hypothetical protein
MGSSEARNEEEKRREKREQISADVTENLTELKIPDDLSGIIRIQKEGTKLWLLKRLNSTAMRSDCAM